MMLVFVASIIPFGLCFANPEAVKSFTVPGDVAGVGRQAAVCIPVPECQEIQATFECRGRQLQATLVETAYIRDQRIAIFAIDDQIESWGEIQVRVAFPGASSEISVDAGPLTGVCSRALVGYGVPAGPLEFPGTGTVVRCHNQQECRDAYADILLVAGHTICQSQYVDSLAWLWAGRMGLNVGIIDVQDISAYSPVEIRDFLRSLYNSLTAEHFGDGHLGFVVLLGDAYENDNVTPMVPEYDGYGGDAKASDHFYACLSGSDEFEDVMLGRIPVGTEQELINYYSKLAAYSPLPQEEWTGSVLFAAGCYFAQRQDYVNYFDSLAAYAPPGFTVSRFYRYDYPATDLGDGQACQAMVDLLKQGQILLFYSGDGDKWDWGARFERVFRSDLIDELGNSDRLPIVLSISFMNGCLDNETQTYTDGGVDCFAERLLTRPAGGAIGCLAASRETGGNASTVFAPEIIKSMFINGSSLLGELILEAKTQHLAKLGSVVLVRQFNLFGDPCLNFVLHDLPVSNPDLVVRPYSVEISPDFPMPGKPLQVKAEVWNASGVPTGPFQVQVFSAHPDSGGTVLASQVLSGLCGWETKQVSFAFEGLSIGSFDVFLVADAAGSIAEIDEANNLVAVASYVYPCERGYPLNIGDEVEGQVVADLNGDGRQDLLVTSGGTQALALDLDGSVLWVKDNMGSPQWHLGIEPSAFDLNGDGTTEAILTDRSAVMVVEGTSGNTIWKKYTQYPVLPPLITDLEGDGSFEIVTPTYTSPFSTIYAFDASGSYVWVYNTFALYEKITGMAVYDLEFDGKKEVVFSTDDGKLTCLSFISNPPQLLWQETLSASPLSCLVAGDVERDGSIEIVTSCDSTVYLIDAASGETESSVPVPARIVDICLGDLDQDGTLEIVCVGEGGRLIRIDDGTVTLNISAGGIPVRAPVLADLDQNGSVEIIVALERGVLKVVGASGSDFIPPVPMKGRCLSAPAAQDVDGDGNIEIMAGTSDSLLFMLDLGVQGGAVEWMGEGCTGTRTGLYAQPLFGMISDDWVMTGRIDVVGDVIIDSTGCLTIARGADVRFVHDDVSPTGSAAGLCEFEVNGDLAATGTVTEQVRFRPISYPASNNEWMGILLNQQASASLTYATVTGAVTGIECMTSDAYLSECRITNCMLALKITDAAPVVDHNTLVGNDYGISASGSNAIIVGNTITGNAHTGVVLSGSSNAILDDNTIGGTLQGHCLACYSSSPSLRGGNRFESSAQCGLYLSNSSPVIDSCWIAWNGDCGIKAAYYSDPVVTKTSIVGNRIGIGVYVYADPILGDTLTGLGGLNDIRQNTQYAFYNTTANRVKAQNNWWGAAEPDPGMFVGSVDYSAWLTMSPAGIEDPGQNQALLQSLCPNPFSGSIVLSLAVSQKHLPVAVSIYDVRGRLLKALGPVELPGRVRMEWDGCDDYGNPVASGAYFLLVTSRTESRSSKIILLR